jgi:hypothetical protein
MKERSMSKTAIAFYVFVAGLGLGATRATAQEVNVDQDKQADLVRCATYAWVGGQPAQDPLVDKHIVEAIDGALAAKGWRKVQGNPGCYVMYQASLREQRSLQIWNGGGRFRGGMGSVDVQTVLNGMLVVDIADGASRQLVWRAVGKDTVSDKTSKNEKKLAKVVDKMFKDLPVAAAKS